MMVSFFQDYMRASRGFGAKLPGMETTGASVFLGFQEAHPTVKAMGLAAGLSREGRYASRGFPTLQHMPSSKLGHVPNSSNTPQAESKMRLIILP